MAQAPENERRSTLEMPKHLLYHAWSLLGIGAGENDAPRSTDARPLLSAIATRAIEAVTGMESVILGEPVFRREGL